MNIVEINSVNYGSTGNIMLGIAETARKKGYRCVTCCAPGRSMCQDLQDHIFIGTRAGHYLHSKIRYLTGLHGVCSVIDTLVFLVRLRRIKPDIIHLHNLHNDYINLPLLFVYIKRHKIPVVWTLHDCWAMTGQCPYFTMVKCERWKTGCHDCPQINIYPASKVDKTNSMWKVKKKWFTGVKNLTIITPSQWLADLVKQSYLKNYPVKVIHNGIDLTVFHPTESNFREQHGIRKDQIMLLGVAYGWGKRKGFDIFLELAKRLDDKYRIVLVGTNDEIDRQLPSRIISIHRTQNQKELAEIYTAADVFLNPTREDNFPTVNLEALGCGIPVITFDTGGSPESINEQSGIVVSCDDVSSMEAGIRVICEGGRDWQEASLARGEKFDRTARFEEYIELFSNLQV